MKRILLFTLSILSLGIYAQNNFTHVHPADRASYQYMALSENQIVAVGNRNIECIHPYIVVLDRQNGEELAASFGTTNRIGQYVHAAIGQDGTIWATGYLLFSLDVINSEAILSRFTPEGELISNQIIARTGPEYQLGNIQQLSLERWLWNTGEEILLLNNDGLILDNYLTPAWHYSQMAVIDSNRFVRNYDIPDLEGELLEIVNTDGSVESSFNIAGIYNTVKDLLSTDDGLYWVSQDSLFFHSYDSPGYQSWVFPDVLVHPRLVRTDNEIMIYETQQNTCRILRFNPSTHILTPQLPWEVEQKRLKQIVTEGEAFLQMGDDFFEAVIINNAPLRHSYIMRTPALDDLDGLDIGVSAIDVAIVNYNIYEIDINQPFAEITWTVQAEITNYSGQDTVNNFIVASPASFAFDCVERRVFMQNNSELLPGATTELSFSYSTEFRIDRAEDGRPLIDYDFCLFTAAPNSKIDKNYSNNTACESFYVVDTQEAAPTASTVRLIPNPANHTFRVQQVNAQIERIEIYNAFGQLLQSVPGASTSTLLVDAAHLPSGYYLLVIQSDLGITTKTLIVQH